ncbi:MAG: metallophosphoesterase family protein [Ruminococcaceae bacterium]|nr:metallophosphoesterase family protein [Oscillospiraceae bacterium]
MKKIMSVVLCAVMTGQVAVNSFAAFDAPKLSESEWNSLYISSVEDNTLPMLNVGADETQVSLCWHADKASAQPQVILSNNSDMSDAVVFNGITTPAENDRQLVCRVTVTGLKENTVYYYQWNKGTEWSGIEKYETKSFSDHKVMVVGDIQIAEDWREDSDTQEQIGHNWNNVLAEALEKNPDISFLVSPGDNTSTGETEKEWQTLLTPKALRSLPLALAIGNHDKKGMMYNYYTNMPNEYYGRFFAGLDRDFWFRYGDVLYLFYDSTSGNAPDHMAMTKKAVKENLDAKWRIGVVHHGIYGAGDCIGDAETEILLTTIFAPIFETYDLDLVITGHTHSQGRSHFMQDTKVVGLAESGKTYTDPKGIVYLNSNSVCEKVIMDYEAEHLAYSFMENDVTTYTTLDFKGDALVVETRRGDNSQLLDSITIVRTKEHNENSAGNILKRAAYKVVEFVGLVYTLIDNLVRKLG